MMLWNLKVLTSHPLMLLWLPKNILLLFSKKRGIIDNSIQLSNVKEMVLRELREYDLSNSSPMDAINFIAKLKRELQRKD